MVKKAAAKRRRKRATQESLDVSAQDSQNLLMQAIEAGDVATTRQLLLRNGTASNSLRMKAWPLLIQQLDQNHDQNDSQITGEEHRDVHVVDVDCERSLWHRQVKSEDREPLRARLKHLINSTLSSLSSPPSEAPHYYQGLNDIASVLLLLEFTTKGAERGSETAFASACLSSLVRNHLVDFTRATMEATIEILQLLNPLVKYMDPELHTHLESTGILDECFFALPWLITWFTHEIKSAPIAFRLFDLFLSSHPLLSIYVGAAVMSRLKLKLMESTEMHEAHVVLSHIALDPSADGIVSSRDDLETLISYALDLYDRFTIPLLLDTLSSGGKKGSPPRPLLHCITPWSSIVNGRWKVPSENMWHLQEKKAALKGRREAMNWRQILVSSRGLLLSVSLGLLLVAINGLDYGKD